MINSRNLIYTNILDLTEVPIAELRLFMLFNYLLSLNQLFF
ncbi:Uncharacterised protein [Limosilactobacillus oris]|nr:Uncharacterised protein [Limosilactobacillus oris]